MKKNNIFAIVVAIIAIAVVCLSGSLFEDADKSKNYVCQMPVTGEYVVWTDGGLQWQGLGNVRDYSKTSQIEFSDLQRNESGYVATGENLCGLPDSFPDCEEVDYEAMLVTNN